MDEKLYFISEVSKIVGVEPHVLRYWEEEMGLVIQRNLQGKRCYSERDVEQLCRIKYWKDKGLQLKAVKEFMEGQDWTEGGKQMEAAAEKEVVEAENETETETEIETETEAETKTEEEQDFALITVEESSDSMQKLEQLLDYMIGRALDRNNEKLVREICDTILQELEDKLEVKMEELLQQELMREMLQEGEREAAAGTEKHKKGFLKRWKKWLERYI